MSDTDRSDTPVNDSPNGPNRFDTEPALDIAVEVTCDTCGKTETFQVNRARFTAWRERRMLIQDALSHLSIPHREFLKSRICPSCWTEMFGSNPFGADLYTCQISWGTAHSHRPYLHRMEVVVS